MRFSRWWCIGAFVMLVLPLGLSCAQKRGTLTQPWAVSRLTWQYREPAPERFVIQRRLEWQAWTEAASVAGTTLTWSDTTLAPGPQPQRVQYRVFAVVGEARSEATRPSTTTIPAVAPAPAPGECTIAQPEASIVVITCALPDGTK